MLELDADRAGVELRVACRLTNQHRHRDIATAMDPEWREIPGSMLRIAPE